MKKLWTFIKEFPIVLVFPLIGITLVVVTIANNVLDKGAMERDRLRQETLTLEKARTDALAVIASKHGFIIAQYNADGKTVERCWITHDKASVSITGSSASLYLDDVDQATFEAKQLGISNPGVCVRFR